MHVHMYTTFHILQLPELLVSLCALWTTGRFHQPPVSLTLYTATAIIVPHRIM